MPTARPRHTITETDAVARALDAAAERWPEDAGARGRLLMRLVEEGHAAIANAREQEIQRRRRAVRETAGILTGVYRDHEVQRLREEWPD